VSPAFYWLALLVGFLLCLIVPTALYTAWRRCEYRQYLLHMQARSAWRDRIVGGPQLPHHRYSKPRIVKQGQFR
jgi:hypothetical protein